MGMENFEVMDLVAENSLTDYELAIAKGMRLPNARAVRQEAVSEALRNALSAEVDVGGQCMSVADSLVVKVLANVYRNPTTADLKNIATILGDIGATKVDVQVSLADRALDELSR